MVIKQILITFSVIIWLWAANIAHASTELELLKLIESVEHEYNIPKGLLLALAKTESNLKLFALNIAGRPVFLKDADIALKAIREALESGITNIDIGIAQVNYKWHGHNFSSIEDMLSPEVNIKYAAKLLSGLKQEHGDWHKAIRYYHSTKPEHHRKYSRKIILCWLEQ